jgi:hypothetical protein
VNGKLSFRSVLQGKKQGRPPFVPFVYGLAARTANVSLREMVSDASCYSNALEGFYRLLDYEVVVTGYDTTVEAERWGGEVTWTGEYAGPVLVGSGDLSSIRPEEFLNGGRIGTLLEVTKRLVLSVGREAAIAAAVSGPCALTKGLQLASAGAGSGSIAPTLKLLGGLLNKLVRSLCESKVDAVFFREDPMGPSVVQELLLEQDAYRGLYATLFNIVRAFNAFPILVTSGLTLDAVQILHGVLRPDGIVFLDTHFDDLELLRLNGLADVLKISLGLPLPIGAGEPAELWDRLNMMKSVAAASRPGRLFFTSNGEIPPDVPMEVLHGLMQRLKTESV